MKLIRTILAAALLLTALPSAADDLQGNLRRHINHFTAPSLQGRKAGSQGEKSAAEYLYKQLEAIGVTMLTGSDGDTFTIVNTDGSKIASQNIVGILEGEDPTLKEEYIVVGAHIDHLGTYSVNVDGQSEVRVYPGACADASGLAVLIEAARILSEDPYARKRSIIFAGFGAMEEEFAGSRYFATAGGFGQIRQVKLMVNLDMLGRGGASNPFEAYPTMPLEKLSSMMKQVLDQESVPAVPGIHNGVVFPSDHLAFKQAEIPAVTFSTGIFKEYRTVKDTPDLMLYDNLAAETVYIAAFLKTVAGAGNASTMAEDRVYSINECDIPPEFFNSPAIKFLEKWVYKYLKFPQEAISDGVEGYDQLVDRHGNISYRATVNVSFIVEADGSVTNVKVERGFSEALDAEAVKVVAASPKWKPGVAGGKKVRTKIVIPVEFHLKKR